ncbi:DUF1631 family protein [Hydrogenophaga soli]
MGPTAAATARTPNLFHACLEEALAEAPGLIMRWTNGLQEVLRQQEAWTAAPAAKAQLSTALRELLHSKTACMERWPAQWRAAIQEAVRRRGDLDLPKRSLATVSFDELELMDDSQIQSTVQAARVEQAAKGAAGSVLADLTALLSSVQGFTSVRPENNPVRPEVAIQALRQTLETLCRDAAIRDLWLLHGSEALGQELQILYRQLVHWLTQKGVKPADYKVIQTSSPVGVGVRHSSGRPRPVGLADQDNLITPQAIAPAQAEAEPSAFLTLDYLHDMLATGPGVLTPQVPAAPLSASGLPGGGFRGPGADGSARSMGPSSSPKGGADEPAHLRALAVEVVNLMLDGMARDPRLLPPVMALIQRMQPALLRIAADDPRFFVDRGNPARKLLDDITQRNLALASDDAPGLARLCSTLEDVVGLLQRTDVRVSSLFETALDVLQGLDAQQDAPLSPPTAQAVQSLVQVEQRQLLVERVSKDLRERPDFATAVPLIQWFLLGPWAQVVAQARLHVVDASSPGARLPASVRYMGVVTDLIWSTRADVASQGRARLARLIPGLLRTLREGLQTIEYEGQTSRQFFAQLMALHEAALKGEAPPPEALAPLDASTGQPLLRPLDVWVRPAEAADSGFMDEDFPPLDSDFEDTLPLVREDEAAQAPSPALEVGTWIELHRESGVWVRLRLVWVSPHGLMYLFSGAGRTSSMSRRHFDDMRLAGRVRLLATQSLVDDALDTVMQAALHNTARRSDGRTDYHADHPDLLPPLA